MVSTCIAVASGTDDHWQNERGTLTLGIPLRLASLIMIVLICLTSGVGTAVLCYGADHSQTESIFAECCWGARNAQTEPRSAVSKAGPVSSSSSCGNCVDVPVLGTEEQSVYLNNAAASASGISISDHAAVIVSTCTCAVVDDHHGTTDDPERSIPLSAPPSFSTVLRC
jgi:hypothetical protein